MKHLSFLLLLSVFLASCGQEVAPPIPSPVAPVKTEVPAPVSEIPKAPVVETQSVPVSTESGASSLMESNSEFQNSENLNWSKRTNKINWWITLDEACSRDKISYLEFEYKWNTNTNATSYLKEKNKLYFIADLDWYMDSFQSGPQTWYLFSYDCSTKLASKISEKNIREIFKWSSISIGYISDNTVFLIHNPYEWNYRYYAIMDRKNNTIKTINFTKMDWFSEMVNSLNKVNNVKNWDKTWDIISSNVTIGSDWIGTVQFSLEKGYNCLKKQEVYSVNFEKNGILKKTQDINADSCE